MNHETITFRQALPQEAGAIALVLSRANAQRDEEPLPPSVTASEVVHMRQRMAVSGTWTYVAADGERLAGFALGFPGDGTGEVGTEAAAEYLSLLMVEPEYWGRRIASRLLDLAAERARAAGRSRLTLWTRDLDNEHARGAYEHKGFRLTGLARGSHYGRQVHYCRELGGLPLH